MKGGKVWWQKRDMGLITAGERSDGGKLDRKKRIFEKMEKGETWLRLRNKIEEERSN